jgi:signal transduction histidine kinase
MTPDGLAPDAAAHDSTHEGARNWRRDVMEGVMRRVALGAIPALVLALVVRTLRREWDLVALIAVALTIASLSLVRRLPPRIRIALIIGAFVWTNGFMMVYARQIPFHGVMMPIASTFAMLMGGSRWGWGTLAVTSVTWLAPWVLVALGWPSPVDMPWPSQYVRLWFFNGCMSAGIIASILHVTRHLEAALARSDVLLERVRTESLEVQALAGRVREAEESERRRLAHDLHDDFGQRLTALRMKLQLSRLRPDQRSVAIDDCVAISEELLQDVRAFARGLRPPLLDEVGLGPALQALVDAHVDRGAFTVTVDVPERLPRLPPPIEVAIYRVVQEAIANALRHAAATRLSLAARIDDGHLDVWLIDNGRGFDTAHASGGALREHLGLVSMRERAGFAGGTLDVDSAPGRGTSVHLRIPVAPAIAGQEPAVAS